MMKYLTTCLAMILLLAGTSWAGERARNSRATGKTREKLRKIVIPKLMLEDVPVSVAFEILRQRSRELDPDGEGVNFVLILKPPAHEQKAKTVKKK